MPDVPDEPSLLLYGVLGADAAADEALQAAIDGRGLQGAPFTLLPCGALAVLASPLRDPSVLRRPDVDTVLAYKEAIDAAHAARPLVPLRFGTRVASPAEARTLIGERAEACRNHLRRFDGRVEMGLRLTIDAEQAPTPNSEARDAASGTAYLEARKRHHDRTRRPLREALMSYRAAVASLVVEETVDERAGDNALSAAFLVPRTSAAAFRRRAAAVQTSALDESQVVGPWAPFTFASLTL
jgi:hypothetical protein